MSEIEKVLTKRGKTHGCFIDQAAYARQLKEVLHCSDAWDDLECDQSEALEMICTKIARVMNGDPNHVDHWRDIEGYARLVANRLEGKDG